MSDQVEGMIRDSDIKFECRLLLAAIKVCPKEIQDTLIEPIMRIVELENQRLDELKEYM